MNALNAANSAHAAVASAQNSLDSANEKLDLVKQGPAREEVAAADAAIASAEASLAAAREKLADVQAGADALQIIAAEAAVASARAGLDSALEKQDEAIRGPEANAIEQAQEAVRTAALAVEAANIRLKNAQIIAPFDGTVAAVNIAQGEFTSLAGTEPAIVLLTPDRLVLKIAVGETDYAALKQEQGGVVIFDGIPGRPYPFRISSIGLSPTVTQGVVTYEVTGELVLLPGSPRPAPGMNARGQITTESKTDVLAIPPRAIRRKGTEQVVDVRRDGVVVEQVVTTGLTDTENVEVLTGLTDGDAVVVPLLTSDTADGTNNQLRTPLPNNIR
jgi:multidrug efflux pump subunit AcrA (membrane-fusion protein)